MNSNIQFLKERLELVERRIASTDDYKEMKVLKRMIAELEGTPIAISPQTNSNVHDIKAPRVGGYHKDMDNSPAAHIPHGRRASYIYDLIEEYLRGKGGVGEIEDIARYLREEKGLTWADKGKTSSSRISTYVSKYNELHTDDQRLQLYPPLTPGNKRVWKYTKVFYTGKQKVKNVEGKPIKPKRAGHTVSEETKRKMSEAKKAWHAAKKEALEQPSAAVNS